ncbi:HAMP domain-containing protein [Duganella radicis]|uniref:histidine kinase n=2 Tax=Duganella radicis TaxID=551988 RepID=A0A6L6PHH1_9BURK|nr:HAMP domain-containing protein [Duganella radicis]
MPQTLMGRMSVALVLAVILSQLVGNWIWSGQGRATAELETTSAAESVANSAAAEVRFFRSLPASYHPTIIQQFRDMGGTRFFATINRAPTRFTELQGQRLAALAIQHVNTTLKATMPAVRDLRVAFAWPDQLQVSDGVIITDLPDNWVRHITLSKEKPAPILVIQCELAPGHWLLLATLMPNPYFLEGGQWLTSERLLLQGVTLAFVLAVAIFVVRWSTYPLAELSHAAEAFGRGEPMPALPRMGSKEFLSTARAFDEMQARIRGYIDDRERLFIGISHDLRTPIMRLKLRAELLDEDAAREEFHEDLDELDAMVKAALQHVRDNTIHENLTAIRLDALIGRMARDARLAGHHVSYADSGLSVAAKPVAFKRVIGNLLDNALHYGTRAEISAYPVGDRIVIEIRDHGPGVPPEALDLLFEPYVRLDHGRSRNNGGMGLGLGIARWLLQSMGGKLRLHNHADGGLVASIEIASSDQQLRAPSVK